MKTRYFNCTVITMNENNDIFVGEVHTQDDKITYVGKPCEGGVFELSHPYMPQEKP